MRFLAFALLLLALPAFSAEGDFVSEFGNSAGDYIVREYLLCDGAPATTCGTQDLTTLANASGLHPYGLPKYIVVDIRADNCTTVENAGFVVGLVASGGLRHQLHSTALDIGTSTSSVTIEPLSHRFVSYDNTVGSGGTCNDLEVVLRLFYHRPRGPGQR